MTRLAAVVFAGVVAALVPRVTSAQTPVTEGDRIRITAESYRMISRIGIVRSVSNDRLVFRPSDSTESVEINYRAIQRLDRGVGSKPGVVPGAIYGTLAGILAGGILGTTCDGGVGDNCGSNWIVGGATGGLALGLVAGFTVLRTDRWVRVTLPGGGAGLGLEAGIRF